VAKFSGKHILLLLLYSPGNTEEINEPILGRTRIVKTLFLFDKEIKKDFLKDSDIELISFPNFYEWYYGPFSKDVFGDIEFFINNGFIDNTPLNDYEMADAELNEFQNWADDFLLDEETRPSVSLPYQECFRLTEKGIAFVESNIFKFLSENQQKTIQLFKKTVNESSLAAIIRYTYMKYPSYTSKSLIKDRIY
jgi:hypothetical protein